MIQAATPRESAAPSARPAASASAPATRPLFAIWEQGDALIADLVATGEAVDLAVQTGAQQAALETWVAQALAINDALRPLEKNFSATLGEGSRWTTAVLLAAMTGAATILTLLGFLRAQRLIRAAIETGRFIGYCGTGKMVTDRKLAQLEVERLNRELETRVRERTDALETANRELEAFSYSIAHDLAAPLRSINARVTILAEDYGDKLGREGAEAIARVRDASVRMGRLIDDLLRLSMASRRQMHRTSIDLSALAESIVADLDVGDASRDVDWRIASVPPASADRDLIRIALANLLQNSCKFTASRERAESQPGSGTHIRFTLG